MTTAATTTITAFDSVHACWQAIIDESIENNIRPVAVPYLAPILDGYATVVWNNLCRKDTDSRAVCDLIIALIAQSNRYRRNGLEVSAADCMFIIDKLKSGEMTVIDNCHL
jgi:hypothetical protein